MNSRRIAKIVLVLLVVNATVCLARPPKVIIDTDFNTIGDDGQVGAMAAQLGSHRSSRNYGSFRQSMAGPGSLRLSEGGRADGN